MSVSSVSSQRHNPYDLAQLGASTAKASIAKNKSVLVATDASAIGMTGQVNLQTDAKSIMAKYDLTNITYRDMAKLGKELVDAGALPEDKLLDFIPLEPGRIGVDGSVRESANEPVNMIERQQAIVTGIKTFGGKGADYATTVLHMYKNFQALHERSAA